MCSVSCTVNLQWDDSFLPVCSVSCTVHLQGDDSFLPVCSVSCTVHLQGDDSFLPVCSVSCTVHLKGGDSFLPVCSVGCTVHLQGGGLIVSYLCAQLAVLYTYNCLLIMLYYRSRNYIQELYTGTIYRNAQLRYTQIVYCTLWEECKQTQCPPGKVFVTKGENLCRKKVGNKWRRIEQ